MNELELYNCLKDNLDNLARLYNITNLSDYYVSTDLRNEHIKSLNGINQVFAQFILHAQNATMISSIVNFDKNYEFIKSVLCDFNPNRIIQKYKINVDDASNDNAVLLLVESFRSGLNWSTEKSKSPDSIIKRFSNSIIDGAKYISQFNDKEKLLNDLNANYIANDHRQLINYLLTKFTHGFSVALCCDFLKELDISYDLPKPDVHLMDVMSKFKGYDRSYYRKSPNRAFECIDDIIEIVNAIKNNRDGEPNLTVYKFDRIVWLCCTGNFFLEGETYSLKENLLNLIN